VKLIWLADSHFLLDVPALRRPFEQYVESIAAEKPDAVLLGGDISNRASLGRALTAFRKIAPTFCVLGNHEYLGALVAASRAQMKDLVNLKPGLVWLSETKEPVWLMNRVALVGADTWGDARAGNLSARNLRRRAHEFLYDQIEDVHLFWEISGSDTVRIARKVQIFLRCRGDEAAGHLERVGQVAAQNARHVLILMHAPPFPEATLHRGEPASANSLPFFCALSAGDAIRGLAESYPDVQFTVLAGHIHHAVDLQVLPNLRVLVHNPGGKGVNASWAVLEVDELGLTSTASTFPHVS
jgi:predicted phosphohydrolase